VRIRDLVKEYGTGDVGVRALDGVDFEVPAGEFTAIMGPSGSGKSTLLHLLGGLDTPTRGEIEIDGTAISRMTDDEITIFRRRKIGFVFQFFNLLPMLTAEENVLLPLSIAGEKPDRAWLEELLGKTGLADRRRHRPSELSGGQQQRVALARALIVDPETLLLDEPLSNLDANLREEMRFEIRRLHDEYRYTTVYVTHDQSEAMTTADLIAVMNGGKIEQAGSPEEIYDRPRSEFVARFIGSSNVVKGKVLGEDRIEFAGTALRCTGAKFIAGRESAVSIRQHDIRLLPVTTQGAENLVPATVRRHVFLGNSRDYMVQVADGTQLRVVTSPEHNVAQGSSVLLHLPPERCRALAG